MGPGYNIHLMGYRIFMYDTILAALRNNATADALVAARELVMASPNDPQAHRWLAAALQQDLQTAAALESMDRAIALAPEDAGLHLALAGLLVSSSRNDEAQAALATTSRLDPNQFQAYLMQAQLALGRGELEEAEKFSRLAARVVPEHPRLAAIDGMVALNRGDSTQAMQIVSMAIRQAPEDHQLRHALGFIYMAQQHWAFAEQAFRSVLESSGNTDGLRSLIANLLDRQGRPRDAADELEPLFASPVSRSPALCRYASRLRMAGGQPEEALTLCEAH
jgi:Flp pilus assembly protein TadD, contains TPR repeats